MSLIRSRWAAIGAAVAVALGGGSIALVSATSPSDSVTFVPITPCRVIDTRPDFQVGLRSAPLGPNDTHSVDATGTAGECTEVPDDATAVSLNVTTIDATDGTFLTIWETGEPRPNASSLNPAPNQPPTPNAVTTTINTGGEFSIFNFLGNVHVFADINGYYIDHHHDDRYYTKGEVDGAILDIEPSAAAFAGDDDVMNVGNDPVVVASVSLELTALGAVIVNASASAMGSTSPILSPRCSISRSASVDANAHQIHRLATDDLRVFSGTRGFAVNEKSLANSATHTYNYVCTSNAFSESFDIVDPHITAIFVPSSESE